MSKPIHYERTMQAFVAVITILMMSLVGVNLLLYISIPDHVGPSNAYIQLEKRVNAVEERAKNHYNKNYYRECRDAWMSLEIRVKVIEIKNV